MFKQLLASLLDDVLGPLGRRAGSVVGGLVAGLDVAPDQVVQIESAVALIVGVAVDLVSSKVFRKALFTVPPKPRAVRPRDGR